MYCVKCGVELQKGIKRCPLCGLPVYHPDISETPDPPSYPRYAESTEQVRRGGLLFVLTVLFLVPALISLLADLKMNGRIRWSGFVIGGLLVFYISFCLPLWFRKPNPVIFFPAAGSAALLLALYVCVKTGGRWFLPFALPVGGAALLLIEAVIVLLRYTVRRRSYRALYILGGASIAAGALCLLIEFLLHVTFSLSMRWWCLYPLSALTLLGMMMIVIAICPSLRESLHKKLFI